MIIDHYLNTAGKKQSLLLILYNQLKNYSINSFSCKKQEFGIKIAKKKYGTRLG
jgi:hypothetical protein